MAKPVDKRNAPINRLPVVVVENPSLGRKVLEGLKAAVKKCAEVALRVLKAIGQAAVIIWSGTGKNLTESVHLAAKLVKYLAQGFQVAIDICKYLKRNPDYLGVAVTIVLALAIHISPLKATATYMLIKMVKNLKQGNYQEALKYAGFAVGILGVSLYTNQIAQKAFEMGASAAVDHPLIAGGLVTIATVVMTAKHYQGAIVSSYEKTKIACQGFWSACKEAFSYSKGQTMTVM